MRGRSSPAVRIEASVSRSARRTRSLVICDATSASEICEVTRAFHSPSSTLSSRRAVKPNHLGRKADLVIIDRVRKAHGVLVEWREADGIGPSVASHRQRMAIIRERKPTALGGRGASRDRRRIEMTEIDENRGPLIL
jgi:hypothetical protein